MALTTMIHPPTEVPVPKPVPSRGNGFPPGSREKKEPAASYSDNTDFSRSLIEANRMQSGRKSLEVFVSLAVHVLAISAIILSSLWFTNVLDIRAYTQTLIVGPPPPPPPPPAPAMVRKVTVAPKRVFFDKGKLLAPSSIPREVAMLKEAQPSETDLDGVAGGVPGGVPGGQMGGVIGGVIGGVKTNVPPPPVKKPPVRVGGRVKAPRAIYNPPPDYPAIARSARVEGVVVIKAILDEHGNVMEMSIVSGPPLLYKAALQAVAKWKYQPTYLNEEPISVEMNITVTFQLNG